VAGVAELRAKYIRIYPVYVAQNCATEEMGTVLSSRNGRNAPKHLRRGLDLHVCSAHLSHRAVTCSDDQITIGQKRQAVDTLGQERPYWSTPLIDRALEAKLENVSGLGPGISKLVSTVNDHIANVASHIAHRNIYEF
jgi:hypothetical protein